MRRRWLIGASVTVAVVLAGVLVVRWLTGPELEKVVQASKPLTDPVAAPSIMAGSSGDWYVAYPGEGKSHVEAYRPGRDEPIWRYEGTGSSGNLVLGQVGDTVLVTGATAVLGLDAATGKSRWETHPDLGGYVPQGVVAQSGNTAVIGLLTPDRLYSEGVVAIDIRTGSQLWTPDRFEGRDRWAQVPGTSRLVRWADPDRVELLDIPSGRVLATAPGRVTDRFDLYATDRDVILSDIARSVVFTSDALRERWRRDTMVRPAGGDHFYVRTGAGGDAVDRDGKKKLWSGKGELSLVPDNPGWGYMSWYDEEAEAAVMDFVDLDDGDQVSEGFRHRRDMQWVTGNPDGYLVIDPNKEAIDDMDVHPGPISFASILDGDVAELGEAAVRADTCVASVTHFGCLDGDRKFVLYRYEY